MLRLGKVFLGLMCHSYLPNILDQLTLTQVAGHASRFVVQVHLGFSQVQVDVRRLGQGQGFG